MVAKHTETSLSDDEVRDAILRYLNDVHRKARSPQRAGLAISDLQAAMRAMGLSQHQVAANLDYLIQKGWVRDIEERRMFTTRAGTTQTASKHIYKISDVGIDHLEGASLYRRPSAGTHVNVTNIHGVTVVGEGNVVNTSFSELSKELDMLRDLLLMTAGLDDEKRLVLVADIDSLQAQLQKPTPSREVVAALWHGIENVVNGAGLVELGVKVAALISPLLS
jgi:hypothetical protein